MATDDAREVDDLGLAVVVARRHYLQQESKTDIARSLGMSRFKVARLLEAARAAGLIRIEIDDPAHRESLIELGDQVRHRYPSLSHVQVAPGPDARAGGNTAGPLLERLVTSEDVLGLPWARAVHYAVEAIGSLPAIPVVQLCGSLMIHGESTPTDVVRRAATLAGGAAHIFHAPLIMPTAAGAAAVRRQPDVARALSAAADVTIALASVGAWTERASTVHDSCSPEDRQAAADAGVIGETMGVLFDQDGCPLEVPLAERLVTISGERFGSIPRLILMSRGRSRVRATRALLAGHQVSGLVLDAELATALLED